MDEILILEYTEQSAGSCEHMHGKSGSTSRDDRFFARPGYLRYFSECFNSLFSGNILLAMYRSNLWIILGDREHRMSPVTDDW